MSTLWFSLEDTYPNNRFAASSDCISIYDLDNYTSAPEVLRWPASGETIRSISFNPSETSVVSKLTAVQEQYARGLEPVELLLT